MKETKISHIEIYYKDGTMERIDNQQTEDVGFTESEKKWIKNICKIELNGLFTGNGEVTLDNYGSFSEEDFDLKHSEYQIIISILDKLIGVVK